MEILTKVLGWVMNVMSAWLMVLLFFQLAVSFLGYKKNTKDYQDHDPKLRFMVLVPAHNEEPVIGDLINNLSNMDYPREMYDFYILADNCTDNTAELARSMGAKVLISQKDGPDAPTGKPIALKKALEALEGYHEKYDMVMFVDADNLVDANMFREINSQYLSADGKADIIQCYLGAKNRKGIVALFYYMTYTITNRFFQYAKTRLGVNSIIGGTGFAVSAKYLHQRGGWTAMSLTEDFELQVQATCEGRRILWNNNVRIYDEKPTRFMASFRQRTRWAQGHWFVAFKNTPKLFGALFKRRISLLEFVSTFLYLYSLTPAVFLVIQTILSGVLMLLDPTNALAAQDASIGAWVKMNLPGVGLFFYMFVFLFYVAEWMDNHIRVDLKLLPQLIVSMVINTAVASWAQVVGLAKHRQQSKWVKTEHSITHKAEVTVTLKQVGLDKANKTSVDA
ncbi:MAG: glycosyltransferase family 2 protein [Clostridia bacterium]|nr:glycosyltransferase family 2 protein [Clostridia bacterium]